MATESPPSADAQSELTLRPALGPRWALTIYHVATAAFFGVLLFAMNLFPLRSTDLWGHVDYGRWIATHHQLPTGDPFQPLAEGVRLIDTSWLSQLLLAGIDSLGGAEGLSNTFALVTTLTYILLTRAFYLQTGRMGVALLGTAAVLAISFSRLTTFRPEVFSSLLFALLCWRLSVGSRNHDGDLATETPRVELWFVVPVLFVLWANLHGSFLCGIVLLGCLSAGRLIDRLLATRSWRATCSDRAVQRWVLLTELAMIATLVNPYGADLWIEVVGFAQNRVLASILEWQPLAILGPGGREFAGAFVGLLALWRHSPRTVRMSEVLLLTAFGWMTVQQNRGIGWFAIVFAFVAVPHLAAIIERLRPLPTENFDHLAEGELPPGRSWRYTIICAGIAWVAFAMSGVSRPLLGGSPRSTSSLYGTDTPVKLTEYLRANPPTGQIYNPQWFGDWLVFAGPAGIKPFATTHVHMLPWQVWADHQRVQFAENGWESVFDRYGIDTVVVDQVGQATLNKIMRRQPGWTKRYEDDLAAVFVRNRPGSKSITPTPAIPTTVAH